MSEFSKGDNCASCPERSCVSRMLARLGRAALPEDCSGPTTVHRGDVITQTRVADEPAPPSKTWNSVIGSMRDEGDRRYNRIEWQTEKACGRELILPEEDEVLYQPDENEGLWVDADGQKHVIFIGGTEQQQADARLTLSIPELL